ncbi:LysM peptidoglycan-binding domain-containing protein [Micrococcus luteus]|nr:LysM peptidoglycan-binding domain-containing protein [Micrococcus luteus]MCV7623691.1 LysM peptidoglycan-binding domain-containing protein [Micrococcus luteus]
MTLAGLLAANGATSTMPLRTGQAIVVPAASIHTAATARTGTTYSGPMPVSAQGPRVTVVGDSSALESTSLMNLEMPGITVDAKEDRTFAEGLTRLGQLKAAGRLRDNVVLGLGVNTGGATAAQARQAMDLVGPDRELVLVTASGPVAWKAFTEQAMRDLAARYPGRVAVADWEAASRYVTDFRADRIHPRAQGLSVDAQLVRLAVGRATGGLTVTVQAGQTLSGIAVAYAVPGGWSAISRATGVPLAQLPSLNGATLSTVLHPGQALRIRLPLT